MSSLVETNSTNEDFLYAEKLKNDSVNWAWWLNNIGTLIVFVIGCCGNILCLLVLCRRRLRRNSYTQYLIALAIVDTVAILAEVLSALDELYQFEYKLTLIVHNNVSCKLFNYIRHIFYSMSSWITVALAIERLIAIKFPLWSKTICTVVNARRIILIILLFTMVIQSYHLVIKGLDCSRTSAKVCRCKTLPHPPYSKLDIALTAYVWRLALMTLLPLTIIIIANILIMNKLREESSLIDHTNSSCHSQHKTKIVYKISRMLVIVTSTYLLLHVPGSSLEIIKFMCLYVFKIKNPKVHYYIKINHEIFDLLTNCNYGINFYLYIISGKHIRNELIRLFKHSPFHSRSSVQHCNCPRSSYCASCYLHSLRNDPVQYSNLRAFKRRSSSYQQRMSLYEDD